MSLQPTRSSFTHTIIWICDTLCISITIQKQNKPMRSHTAVVGTCTLYFIGCSQKKTQSKWHSYRFQAWKMFQILSLFRPHTLHWLSLSVCVCCFFVIHVKSHFHTALLEKSCVGWRFADIVIVVVADAAVTVDCTSWDYSDSDDDDDTEKRKWKWRRKRKNICTHITEKNAICFCLYGLSTHSHPSGLYLLCSVPCSSKYVCRGCFSIPVGKNYTTTFNLPYRIDPLYWHFQQFILLQCKVYIHAHTPSESDSLSIASLL